MNGATSHYIDHIRVPTRRLRPAHTTGKATVFAVARLKTLKKLVSIMEADGSKSGKPSPPLMNDGLGNEGLIPQLFSSVPALNEAASYLAQTTSYLTGCFSDYAVALKLSWPSIGSQSSRSTELEFPVMEKFGRRGRHGENPNSTELWNLVVENFEEVPRDSSIDEQELVTFSSGQSEGSFPSDHQSSFGSHSVLSKPSDMATIAPPVHDEEMRSSTGDSSGETTALVESTSSVQNGVSIFQGPVSGIGEQSSDGGDALNSRAMSGEFVLGRAAGECETEHISVEEVVGDELGELQLMDPGRLALCLPGVRLSTVERSRLPSLDSSGVASSDGPVRCERSFEVCTSPVRDNVSVTGLEGMGSHEEQMPLSPLSGFSSGEVAPSALNSVASDLLQIQSFQSLLGSMDALQRQHASPLVEPALAHPNVDGFVWQLVRRGLIPLGS
ncbi:hypothetical protein HHK36_028017 [Tetracentron sinense]|uniref:Uncharacterized protein n=1 Tax=Tetracentron sinense TaxID=13715 RepID=A0A835D226_TETSI|nr:hypothetical protein HHK36_028017 [Tetracentron sinense]